MELSEQDLLKLSKLVATRLGIQLTPQKRALIIGRLQQLVRQLGLDTFSEYCDYVEEDPTGRALTELANRISTNHTFFYREAPHFDFLTTRVLPPLTASLEKAGTLDLRMWCAACATGEEAYTLAMLQLEHFGSARSRWKAGLLATDISERALQAAARGVFAAERASDLPAHLRSAYLQSEGPDRLVASDALKAEVTFRRLNLINDNFPFRKPFHVIFCRNVMIYFDRPTRERLVARMVDALTPGGHLFIGHSESIPRSDVLEVVSPSVYRKAMA